MFGESVSAQLLLAGDTNAAAEIIAGLSLRGAVLVRLSVDDAAALARLLRYSLHFFEKPHGEKAYVARDAVIPGVGPAAVRVGWRQPSASKELLRCFRGHPLPLPPDTPLSRAAGASEALLHALLSRCANALLGPADVRAASSTGRSAECGAECGAALLPAGGSGGALPRLSDRFERNCAFDIFYYRADGCEVPCDAHVDRGLLHAIWAPAFGLQLWQYGAWRSPAEVWPSFEPWRDVVVLVNAEAEELSTEPWWPHGRMSACVHRVVRVAQTRVSVSYELRAAFTAAAAVEAEVQSGEAEAEGDGE